MWISVKDRLPDLDRKVDVWRRGTGRWTDCLLYHVNSSGLASWGDNYGGYAGGASVTHWMEIPGPPADALPGIDPSCPSP